MELLSDGLPGHRLPSLLAFVVQIGIITIITASLALQDLQQVGSTAATSTCLLGIAITQVLILLSAVHIVRQTLTERISQNFSDEVVTQRLEVRLTLHRSIWIVSVFLILTCFQWPQHSISLSPNRFVARFMVLAPVTLPLLLGWAIFYSVERELDVKLKKRGRMAFVMCQARLFLLLPLGAILFVVVCQDAAERIPHEVYGTSFVFIIRIAPLALIALGFPTFLRMAWKTEPMRAGVQRRRLEHYCEKFAFVKRDILVWNTDNRLRNAAISGILPNWRYILLSDRLLADLPPQHVESIFLHEVGHARNRHPIRLIGVAVLMICASIGTIVAEPSSMSVGFMVPVVGLAGLAFAFVLIGRFARLFEFQADLWAAKQLGDYPLDYLRAVAAVSNGAPNRRSWMHPSFDQRCEFLLRGADRADRWLQTQLWLALLGTFTLGISLTMAQLLG